MSGIIVRMGTRTFVLLAFVGVLFAGTLFVQTLFRVASGERELAAVFVNDSNIVEVNDPGPATPPTEQEIQSGADTAPPVQGETSATQNGQTQTDAAGLSAIPAGGETGVSSGTQDTPVIVEVETAASTDTQNQSGAPDTQPYTTTSGGATTQTKIIPAEDIFAALIENRAVVSAGGGGATGNFLDRNGIRSMHVYANRVRSSFRALGIVGLTPPFLSGVSGTNRASEHQFSQNDFILSVSSLILQNDALSDVDFRQGVLSAEYRALGHLFGFVPARYTLRVSLTFSPEGSATAAVRFPWYKFFLRTSISRASLERALQTEVNARLRGRAEAFDMAVRAFGAVAEVLRLEVGV